MKALPNWLRATWDSVRTSLWLVPGLFFLVGISLAPLMIMLDGAVDSEKVTQQWWLTSGGGEDAANLLSTLLTSIITMASMAFSITVVALSLAANSYGPRLIRVFRANLRTQVVLGFFVLTIVYLLVALRSIQRDMTVADVPHLSVTLGALLSLLCVLALLAFIQGVARSIVADEVVRRVRGELDSVVKQLPDVSGSERSEDRLPQNFEADAGRIMLPREGYVQSVDVEGLVHWARTNGTLVRLDFRAGDFVVQGDRKVLVYPAPANLDGARKEIGRFIVSGDERTPTQDLEFAIRHLVEVAVRALSPGINDPFTAIAVIDRLRGALARLAQKELPPRCIYDGEDQLRIVRRVTSYGGAVDAALNQIRQAGSAKPAILIHMASAIGELAEHLRTREQESVLNRHLDLILSAASREVGEEADRRDVEAAVAHARSALRKALGLGASAC